MTVEPLTTQVDPDLLEHREHLPETISCRCGYRRADVTAHVDAPMLAE